jgi:hypothetical protein
MLEWAAADSDPDSCVFFSWEVQAKPLGIEWPGRYMNFTDESGHWIYQSDDNSSSTTRSWHKVYTIRTEWVEDAHASFDYYIVVPSEVDNATMSMNGTEKMTHVYDDLVNITDVVYGCEVRDRSMTTCLMRVARGGGVRYEVRVRETCTDPTLNSAWTYIDSESLLTPIPEVVVVKPVSNAFLGRQRIPPQLYNPSLHGSKLTWVES